MWLSTRAMVPLAGYLRGLGAVPTPQPVGPATPAEALLEGYHTYLVRERGLAASTVRSYVDVAQLFLSKRSPQGDLDLEHLTAGEVTAFVLAECQGRKAGSAAYVVCGLRAMLRFLYVEGYTAEQLAAAVPKVADGGWQACRGRSVTLK